MTRVQFVYPLFLALIILLPIFVLLFVYQSRSRSRKMAAFGELDLVLQLRSRIPPRRRFWKFVLWWISLAVIIVASARPTWGVRTDVVETQGVSIFVLLDVSDSMNAEDVAPSRLERSKLIIRDLLNASGGNEIGLIVFAGSSFVMFPLTSDPQSATSFVNAVTTEVVSNQGTNIGGALVRALDAFSERVATEQMVIVLSDGENHSATLQVAILQANSQNVPVHVIGVGTEDGGSIPIRNRIGGVVGNKQDRYGHPVISKLDEDTLKDIAFRTGGTYQLLNPEQDVVGNLVRIINATDAGLLSSREQVRGVDRFGLFLAIALILLSLEMLLPTGTNS